MPRLTREDMQAFAAEMNGINWNDPEDRLALALKILEYVKEDVAKQDLESMLVDVYNFNLGESPQWIERKGLKAYVHEPGTYSPRSTIVQRVLTIGTEQVSVHPEFEINQLKAGRYGAINDIRKMAVDELLGRKYSIIWRTLLGSIASTDNNYATFASGATAATKKTALNTALDYVEDRGTGVKAIIGRYSALGWISDVDGYSEKYKEIKDSSLIMGDYRGIPIIRLSQYSDGYGNRLIDEDEIMVIGNSSSKLGRNQDLDVMDDINIDDKMWHLRIDEQYGVVVHKPKNNYRLHIS